MRRSNAEVSEFYKRSTLHGDWNCELYPRIQDADFVRLLICAPVPMILALSRVIEKIGLCTFFRPWR